MGQGRLQMADLNVLGEVGIAATARAVIKGTRGALLHGSSCLLGPCGAQTPGMKCRLSYLHISFFRGELPLKLLQKERGHCSRNCHLWRGRYSNPKGDMQGKEE